MTTSIATLNDSLVIPVTKVEFILTARSNNDCFIGEYMDKDELTSIIANAWDRGATQEDVTREVMNLCDDGWDD